MNAKRVFIPIAFVTCAFLGIVPAVYADVPSAQVTPLEEGVAVAGGVLGTDYTMDAATRGRCRRGYRPRFLRDSLQCALTRKGSRQAGAPAGLSKGCSEARQGRTHPVISRRVTGLWNPPSSKSTANASRDKPGGRPGRLEPLLVQSPACIFLVLKLGTAVLHQPSTVGGYVQRFI